MSGKTNTAVVAARVMAAAAIGVLMAVNFFISYRNRAALASDPSTNRNIAADVSSSDRDTTAPEKIHEVARAKISVTGDVIIHNALLDTAKVSKDTYNFDYIYKYLIMKSNLL